MHYFRPRTLKRLARRVEGLKKDFVWSLRAFDRRRLFSGPSQYFHLRTLHYLKRHRSAVEALRDDQYCDALYAALASWGLHRMGPGNAKLRDLDTIRRSLIKNGEAIRDLEDLRLSDFGGRTTEDVTRAIWAVLRSLRVTRAKAFLVANTKTLHHVLPALIPPVDREYTLDFFFGPTTIDGREKAAFHAMFPRLHDIAKAKANVIARWRRRKGWHTSESKVVDNAIVGYWYGP